MKTIVIVIQALILWIISLIVAVFVGVVGGIALYLKYVDVEESEDIEPEETS